MYHDKNCKWSGSALVGTVCFPVFDRGSNLTNYKSTTNYADFRREKKRVLICISYHP